MSAEKRVPPRSFSILQRNSGIVRSCTPFRREHSYLSAADATQEALCQRWNSIWPHESEDSRVVDSMFPNRAASFLSFVRTTHNSRNTPICSVLPQQDRIARLFKPTFLRLESCPQSCPPFGSMCCNQTMTAIFSVDAMPIRRGVRHSTLNRVVLHVVRSLRIRPRHCASASRKLP